MNRLYTYFTGETSDIEGRGVSLRNTIPPALLLGAGGLCLTIFLLLILG